MTSIITEELIDLNIHADNKLAAIKTLAEKIQAADRLSNFEGYYTSVIDREELTTTGIGFGIAIPHGKCPYVKETSVAFGRLAQSIDWQSLDGKGVELIFLLAVPEACKGDQHLKIIASLSRKLIHAEFRQILQSAVSPAEIVNVLNESLATALS